LFEFPDRKNAPSSPGAPGSAAFSPDLGGRRDFASDREKSAGNPSRSLAQMQIVSLRCPDVCIPLMLMIAAMLSLQNDSFADDVSWLIEVTTAPPNPPREGVGQLAPLLVNTDGQTITTRKDWESHRAVIRDQWLKFLGPMPELRPPVKLEVRKDESLPGVTRQLVRYEGEPDLFVEGYLLVPPLPSDKTKRLPGIVALHPTTNATIDEIAGVSGRDEKQTGLKLAQRGFVVFCPRCFLWQDVSSLDEAVKQHRERHPETLGMTKMLYDAMRGVDVLESLSFVDRERIGAVGHSLCTSLHLTNASARPWRVRVGSVSDQPIGMRRGISVKRSGTRTLR